MPTSALSFRREVIARLLPVDEKRYWINADALLFTVGPMLTRVGLVDRPLAEYRVHGQNQMSSGRVDRAELRKRLRSYYDTIVGSNQQLARLEIGAPGFEARDHVLFREQLFALSRLRGARRGDTGRYLALLRAIARDDMYGATQKWLAVPAFGMLMLLPRSWRGPWLDRVRSYGRMKARTQAAREMFRPHPAPPRGPTPGPADPAAMPTAPRGTL
jgi:hypothetical protein